MKKHKWLLWSTFFIVMSCSTFANSGVSDVGEKNIPPKATKEKYERIINGDVVVDYYHWLKDENWPNVKNTEIINHLKAENKYTENYFLPLKDQEEKLIKEMKSRIIEEEETYPKQFDNYYYYRKFIKGGNFFQVCRKKDSLDAREEIILDVNKLADGKAKGYKVDAISPSLNHNLLAYAEDLEGGEKYSISVRDLKKGIEYKDIVQHMKGNIVWHGNNKGFFYTKLDENLRPIAVYYHELSKQQSEDLLVYKENNPSFLINIGFTSDKKYLIINSSNNTENEIRILDIWKKDNFAPSLLLGKKEKQKYFIDHKEGEFYLKINDKGKNFRLVKLKHNDFNNIENWMEIIRHSNSSMLLGYSLSKKYLVVNVMEGGNTKVTVYNRDLERNDIAFEEEVYNAHGYFTTYDSNLVRIDFSSFITPQSVLEYDCEQKRLHNRKTQKVSGKYNQTKYKSEKVYITGDDGIQIPVSLFYRKDKFKKDGTNPLILYGYGGYGTSSFPKFDLSLFSLVDRGFVYAIAHIRGGSELGYKWHEDAKLLNKKRTFQDYINCAEGLIEKKYASSEKIVGYGISAGGMLMGYVINERPELLKVVVTEVPSVDTLNKMLDKSLMGTPYHYSELGDPSIKEYYDYIKSYTPYENIKKQQYPAIYATAGLLDVRVPYWQPAKWIAKLREYNTSNNPILLYTEMHGGHFGQSGRYDDLQQKAKMYTFIFSNLGINVN
jgi:oligopeptidase B